MAFLGIMVPEFPNFFMLYGPNTNGGFIITNIERQANFAALEIKRLQDRKIPSVEVTEAATVQYNNWLQGRMQGTAFVEGKNYFKAAFGTIVTQWPDSATEYGFALLWRRRFARWRRSPVWNQPLADARKLQGFLMSSTLLPAGVEGV